MAKKLPKGIQVKCIVEEKGFTDMYRWAILKDGLTIKEGYELRDTAYEARTIGVKALWKFIEDDAI